MSTAWGSAGLSSKMPRAWLSALSLRRTTGRASGAVISVKAWRWIAKWRCTSCQR